MKMKKKIYQKINIALYVLIFLVSMAACEKCSEKVAENFPDEIIGWVLTGVIAYFIIKSVTKQEKE